MQDAINTPHHPIMASEIRDHLEIQNEDIILDATFGFGGHARLLASCLGPKGRYIGIDQDPDAHAFFQKHPVTNTRLFHANFADFPRILADEQIPCVHKIILDLGFSSAQLDQAQRGFSHLTDEPLNMKMDPDTDTETAADILNTYSAQALSDLFYHHSELYHNKRLVTAIVAHRKTTPFTRTPQLVQLIKQSYDFHQKRSAFMKVCAQVFQALRMQVNQELSVLRQFLEAVPDAIAPQGRLAILSFHAVEDRLIKVFFRDNKALFRPVNKHVIWASQQEIKANRRAKSARLRIFEKR